MAHREVVDVGLLVSSTIWQVVLDMLPTMTGTTSITTVSASLGTTSASLTTSTTTLVTACTTMVPASATAMAASAAAMAASSTLMAATTTATAWEASLPVVVLIWALASSSSRHASKCSGSSWSDSKALFKGSSSLSIDIDFNGGGQLHEFPVAGSDDILGWKKVKEGIIVGSVEWIEANDEPGVVDEVGDVRGFILMLVGRLNFSMGGSLSEEVDAVHHLIMIIVDVGVVVTEAVRIPNPKLSVLVLQERVLDSVEVAVVVAGVVEIEASACELNSCKLFEEEHSGGVLSA